MPFQSDLIEELNMITRFDPASLQEGLKVHSDAAPEVIAATQRLFDKGLITQTDGGYLTDLGHELAQHAQSALNILQSPTTA
jgi:uncharacterized protein (TIGR02647 family)